MRVFFSFEINAMPEGKEELADLQNYEVMSGYLELAGLPRRGEFVQVRVGESRVGGRVRQVTWNAGDDQDVDVQVNCDLRHCPERFPGAISLLRSLGFVSDFDEDDEEAA